MLPRIFVFCDGRFRASTLFLNFDIGVKFLPLVRFQCWVVEAEPVIASSQTGIHPSDCTPIRSLLPIQMVAPSLSFRLCLSRVPQPPLGGATGRHCDLELNGLNDVAVDDCLRDGASIMPCAWRDIENNLSMKWRAWPSSKRPLSVWYGEWNREISRRFRENRVRSKIWFRNRRIKGKFYFWIFLYSLNARLFLNSNYYLYF